MKKSLLFIFIVLISNSLTSQFDHENKEIKVNPDEELNMIFVEGGSFEMGDIFVEGIEEEFPVHLVTVNDFYIGKYEVSRKLWNDIMGYPSKRSDRVKAVANVSWYEIIRFCNKLSAKYHLKAAYKINGEHVVFDLTADGFRLPTEAEWEYSARGGKFSRGYRYSGSNDVDSVAWTGDDRMNSAQPVGVKKCNELGLCDMSGNLAEWVWDYYAEHYYRNSAKENPVGPDNGRKRVIRGGSWVLNSSYSRIASRIDNFPDVRNYHYGFRIARSVRK